MSATAEGAMWPASLPQVQGIKDVEPAPRMIRAEPGTVRVKSRMIKGDDSAAEPEPQVSQVNHGLMFLVGLGRFITLTIVLIDAELTCQTDFQKKVKL